MRVQPLALKTALHVGDGQNDGVNRSIRHARPQVLEAQTLGCHAANLS
jgi:hypothetical protein